jgi:RNA polymerase sigma factor (TIGR02999 family)
MKEPPSVCAPAQEKKSAQADGLAETGGTVTRLLGRARNGDVSAREQIFSRIQDELRRIARHHINAMQAAQLMEVTAAVNEACLRLLEREIVNAQDRRHFYYLFDRAVRDGLVEAVRAAKAQKRGGAYHRVPLGELTANCSHTVELLDLHEAVEALTRVDVEAARIVDLRFFHGLTLEQAADVMQCSVGTARRHWEYARAWLATRLSVGDSSHSLA